MIQNQSVVGKKLVIGAIILVLVFIAFVAIWSNQGRFLPKKDKIATEEKIPKTTSQAETEYVTQGKLPPELPADLPIETDAPILRNEIVKVNGGKEIQHIRSYYSAKTVEENLAIYEKYLLENGWKITSRVKEANIKLLVGSKQAGGLLRFQVTKNSITQDVVVEIMVVKQ